MTVSPELLEVAEISEAVNLAQEAGYTSAELQAYESYWDAVSTEKTLLIGRYEEGKAEGMVEGKVEGEQNTLRKVIQNLHTHGASLEMIQVATGLSLAEINTFL